MKKKLAMGIDIGGTNTAFGLVDEDGNVVAESKISTDKFRFYDDYKVGEQVKVSLTRTMGYKAVVISYLFPLIILTILL